jgi:acyl transferase domain-containing protein
MSGRFPGARSVDALWNDVIRDGREVVQQIEVEDRGTVGYGFVDDPALFDNEFFDMSPAEARTVTPEHRLFLEHVWAAIEDAGIDITTDDGFVSVYGSASNHSASYLRRIINEIDDEQLAGGFGVLLGNAMDSIATRVGYKLGLRGECISVQTHCSSSLVAIHLACQSLLTGHSDVAIAGGVSVRASVKADLESELPQLVAQEGFILSPDGRCFALLDGASGTVSGDGVGVVVLKMLDQALEDGDPIHAVIVGTGINNDGRRKVGFTAPSLDGVTDAIEDALAFAALYPEQIGYVECHGTGTNLGDAIELRALRQVFESGDRRGAQKLRLGSVKSNLGHLAAGAGVTGLIKAALAVENGQIPPLTHAGERDPHSEISDSAVLDVPRELTAWEPASGELRRAGVSSLGIGGTNVHILVEEAPRDERPPAAYSRPGALLIWSAKTPWAADDMATSLGEMLDEDTDEEIDLDDVAHTLRFGRAVFDERRCVAAADHTEAAALLRSGRVRSLPAEFGESAGQVAFVFPGSGAYRAGMADELMEAEPRFREHMSTCDEILKRTRDFSLLDFLSADGGDETPPLQHLQTAVLAMEYALANVMLESGCTPDALIGSSLGEYAAACISGALSIEDALHLVYHRGELLERVTGGSMLLVDLPWSTVEELAPDGIEQAIRVSENDVIVSGPSAAVDELFAKLEAEGHSPRMLPPNIAYHSAAVDPIRDDFIAGFDEVEFSEPQIPYVSNRTGETIEYERLSSPEYWFEQMRHTVLLGEGFHHLHEAGVRLFFEVGPGHGATKFVGLNFPDDPGVVTHPCTAHPRSDRNDWLHVSEAIGLAWLAGKPIDWEEFGSGGRRISLPTYRFQGRYYYLGEETPELDETSRTQSKRAVDRTLPRNAIEEQVAEIWSDVLGVGEIGIDENFFDLGGDSLQATRVLGRMQAEITSDISVEDVMQYRTIREVAALLSDLLLGDEGGEDESAEEDYYCAFELDFGGVQTTIYLSKDEYDANGVPDGAQNVRIVDD